MQSFRLFCWYNADNMPQKSYKQKILDWRKDKDESIRRENGWLSLAGLFWLKLGKNQFGSASENDIQLPGRTPANIGYFEYDGKSVTLQTNPSQKVKVNGKLTDSVVLQPEKSEDPSYIALEDLRLVVIQRGNKLGIRLWDNKREARRSFPARTWYEIDENFRLPATFTPYDNPRMAQFPDMTGEKSEFPVEGYLAFEYNQKRFQLDVNTEEDGTFFVRFWDPSSQDETYPTGRYLITDDEPGKKIFIDFNKAYCPPCAFTEYATCVFAPEQNHLDFRVTAGETYPREK